MYRRRRSIRVIATPLLIAVAIAGYLAGYHRAPAASQAALGQTSRVVSGANVLLEFPSNWRRVHSAPAIPDLQLERASALAPDGAADHAGLISGQLAAGEPSPLPAVFLHAVQGVPHTEVLDFLGGQAYKYSHLSLPGYDRTLNLYVIPNPGNGPTVLVCFAANGFISILAQCEQIVAKLTLVGQSQYDLSPNAGYAQQLGALVRTLDSERLALRKQMRAAARPAAVGKLAGKLATKLAATAASLSALEPPLAAGSAQATLASAILSARDAYQALAAAAGEEQLAAYDQQLKRAEQADEAVDRALEGFALLGYSKT